VRGIIKETFKNSIFSIPETCFSKGGENEIGLNKKYLSFNSGLIGDF